MNARLTPPMVNVSLRITSIRSRGKAGGAVFAIDEDLRFHPQRH